jgi:hypothetical protein
LHSDLNGSLIKIFSPFSGFYSVIFMLA